MNLDWICRGKTSWKIAKSIDLLQIIYWNSQSKTWQFPLAFRQYFNIELFFFGGGVQQFPHYTQLIINYLVS